LFNCFLINYIYDEPNVNSLVHENIMTFWQQLHFLNLNIFIYVFNIMSEVGILSVTFKCIGTDTVPTMIIA